MAPSPRRAGAACLLGLVALAGVAGCGDDEDDDSVSASDLDGRAFLATETEGFTIVAGSEITISFTADTLAVETGCNNVTGSYTIENDVLTPGELAQTLMACDAELTAQERWISDLLASNPSIELDGNELELSSGENSITFGETG